MLTLCLKSSLNWSREGLERRNKYLHSSDNSPIFHNSTGCLVGDFKLMSKYKRLPRKNSLKGPDEFLSLVDRAAFFIQENGKPIFLIAGILALGGIVYLIFQQKTEMDLVALNQDVYEATKKEDVALAYTEVMSNYKKYDVSHLLNVKLLQTALADKKFDEALKIIEESKEILPKFIQPSLILTEARIFWQKGEVEKAILALDVAAKGDDALLKDYASLLKAQILEDKGDVEKAIEIYSQLKESAFNSEVQKLSEARFILLKAQG